MLSSEGSLEKACVIASGELKTADQPVLEKFREKAQLVRSGRHATGLARRIAKHELCIDGKWPADVSDL